MEKFPPLSDQTLREMMEKHDEPIKSIAKSESTFKDVKSYFDFDRGVHFIITLTIFNMASLFLSQAECTKNILIATPITLPGIFVLLIFLGAFSFKITNREFDPAEDGVLRWWTVASVIAFLSASLIEILLPHIAVCVVN